VSREYGYTNRARLFSFDSYLGEARRSSTFSACLRARSRRGRNTFLTQSRCGGSRSPFLTLRVNRGRNPCQSACLPLSKYSRPMVIASSRLLMRSRTASCFGFLRVPVGLRIALMAQDCTAHHCFKPPRRPVSWLVPCWISGPFRKGGNSTLIRRSVPLPVPSCRSRKGGWRAVGRVGRGDCETAKRSCGGAGAAKPPAVARAALLPRKCSGRESYGFHVILATRIPRPQ
jgi:hypothetical protein